MDGGVSWSFKSLHACMALTGLEEHLPEPWVLMTCDSLTCSKLVPTPAWEKGHGAQFQTQCDVEVAAVVAKQRHAEKRAQNLHFPQKILDTLLSSS